MVQEVMGSNPIFRPTPPNSNRRSPLDAYAALRIRDFRLVLTGTPVETILVSPVAQEISGGSAGATRPAKIEIVASEQNVDEIVNALVSCARFLPSVVNGAIVVSPIAGMVRIASGARPFCSLGVSR